MQSQIRSSAFQRWEAMLLCTPRHTCRAIHTMQLSGHGKPDMAITAQVDHDTCVRSHHVEGHPAISMEGSEIPMEQLPTAA